jgi:hypothetical protein
MSHRCWEITVWLNTIWKFDETGPGSGSAEFVEWVWCLSVAETVIRGYTIFGDERNRDDKRLMYRS